MFIGHLGIGLALKRSDTTVNVAWFFAASLLPDLILGILVLLGLEQVIIPENYAELRHLQFVFPFSHGLVATALWAVILFGTVRLFSKAGNKNQRAFIVTVAFLSHFVLDLIVHVPELPVSGNESVKLGMSLWNNLPVALALEGAITLLGIGLYLKSTQGKGFAAQYGLTVFIVVLLLLSVWGQLMGPAPPNETAPAVSWIVQFLVIFGFAYWLDKKRSPRFTADA